MLETLPLLIFIPFTTYEKKSFTEQAGQSLMDGFSDPKIFRDFRETGSWPAARKSKNGIGQKALCWRDKSSS